MLQSSIAMKMNRAGQVEAQGAATQSPLRLAAESGDGPVREADLPGLFDRHAPGIHRFLLVRTGGDTHACDDLMQQLWLAASGNGVKAGVPAGEFEFWLRGVARNLLVTHWRRKASRPVLSADPLLATELAEKLDTELIPPAVLARREVQHQLLLALTELSSDDHDLIVAHYFQGVPHVELGDRLGLSARAIEGRLYRARQELKRLLRQVQ